MCLPAFAFACACLLLLVPACFCLCLPAWRVRLYMYVCVRVTDVLGEGAPPTPPNPPPPWEPGTQGCGRRNNSGLICVLCLCVCVSSFVERLYPGPGPTSETWGPVRVCVCAIVCVCVCVYVCVGGCLSRPRQRTEPLRYQRVFLRTRVSSRHFQKVSPHQLVLNK